MLTFKKGDMFKSGCAALVNTVNCVGVMGKGIALQVKKKFPQVFAAYKKACSECEVRVGLMHVVPIYTGPTKWVINFPTKDSWEEPSRLEWIFCGLADLRSTLHNYIIESVAVPPLGCGNGGLDWKQVRPLIEIALANIPTKVEVYEP